MMRLQDSFAPVTGAPADFGLKTAQLVLALRDLAGKNLEETAVQQAAPLLPDDDLTLILNGDEDWPCLLPGLMLKQTIPSAALCVLPNCGHTMNLEAPDEFNRELSGFLAWVASGRWPMRDPRATVLAMTGIVR